MTLGIYLWNIFMEYIYMPIIFFIFFLNKRIYLSLSYNLKTSYFNAFYFRSEIKFPCTECGTSFSKQKILNIHKQIHAEI